MKVIKQIFCAETKTLKSLLLLVFCSSFLAFLFVSVNLSRKLIPSQNPKQFVNISSDNWILNPAHINLSSVSNYNQLILTLDPWRLDGTQAVLNIYLCGGLYLQKKIVDHPTRIDISLAQADCDPIKISFDSPNVTKGVNGDSRDLILRLESARLSSGLFLAIPKFDIFLKVFLVLFSSLLVLKILSNKFLSNLWLVYFFIISAALLFILNPLSAYNLVFYLILIFILITCGYHLNSSYEIEIDNLKPWRLLSPILLGGFFLRLYGVNFGLPLSFHPDEARKVTEMTKMLVNNSWDPNYFLHPSLLLYLTIFVKKFFGFFALNFYGQADLFLAGRLVSVIFGSLSIYLVYQIGRSLYSINIGLISSALFAFAPLSVTCSRYMKEDALFLFFFLACTNLVVLAMKNQDKSLLYRAGLFGGISAGSKYTGFLSIIIIGISSFLLAKNFKPNKILLRATPFALIFVALGFLICTPFSVINYQQFLRDLSFEQSHMLRGHSEMIDAWSQLWTYHFSRSLLPGFTIIPTILSLIGIGILLRRRNLSDLILLGLILIFYLPAEWVKAKPAPQPERYILPCLPFLAIAAAIALSHLNLILSKQRQVLASFLVLAFVVLSPLIRSLQLASEIYLDTRLKTQDWIEKNIDAAAKIMENGGNYNVQFAKDRFDLQGISFSRPEIFGPKTICDQGAKYFVASSLAYARFFEQPNAHAIIRAKFQEIFDQFELVHQEVPKYGTYGFHNPTLRVYKVICE